MRGPRTRAAQVAAVTAAAGLVAAACGLGDRTSSGSGISGPTGDPIKVGVSLPLTGSFGDLGQATEKGYQLWASDVNNAGGLLGRPVKLVVRNDKSDPDTTARDYRTLITADHVDLTLAPFSSLLTIAAAPVAAKYGYVMTAGSSGAPGVYNLKLRTLFSTTPPAALSLVPFANWVLSMPAGKRPTTAAYPAVDNPFTVPPLQTVQGMFERAGIKTVYSHAPYTNTSTAAITADTQQVARANAQVVLLGTVDLPTVSTFVNEFAKLGYNPRMLLATSGPDQGQAFLDAVGMSDATGIMASGGWYANLPNALSHVMVQNYIAKYGGRGSDIPSNVAEAYSAGEILADAVTATASLDQRKITSYLRKATLQTVVGPAKFGPYGQNELGLSFISQWQPGGSYVQVLPRHAAGSAATILTSKPDWVG